MAKVILSLSSREATRREIEIVLKHARSETHARSKAEHRRQAEAETLIADAKKVAAAIRKSVREQASARIWIGGNGGRGAGGREVPHDSQYEIAAGFAIRKPSARGRDGLSSFHFKWTSRGYSSPDTKRTRPYKAGEARHHIRYVIRLAAREVSSKGGLASNISDDPDKLAAFFDIVEELETHDRVNANVYCSIVVSLPHELTADQRAELFAAICAVLGRYDLPYCGANHLPDPEGDQRNFHGHIVASLRPFRIAGDGAYEFSDTKSSDLNDASFIVEFRAEAAELMNLAMAKAGHPRRITALSDADRGFAPRTKASGKDGIGKKSVERRAAKLESLRAARVQIIKDRGALVALSDRLAGFGRGKIAKFEARIYEMARCIEANLPATYIVLSDDLAAAMAAKLTTARARLNDASVRLSRQQRKVVARYAASMGGANRDRVSPPATQSSAASAHAQIIGAAPAAPAPIPAPLSVEIEHVTPPGANQAPSNPTGATASTKGPTNEQIPDYALLDRVRRVIVAIQKRDPAEVAGAHAARSHSSVRKLSGINLVQHTKNFTVQLPDAPVDLMGNRGRPDPAVRRPRDGDRPIDDGTVGMQPAELASRVPPHGISTSLGGEASVPAAQLAPAGSSPPLAKGPAPTPSPLSTAAAQVTSPPTPQLYSGADLPTTGTERPVARAQPGQVSVRHVPDRGAHTSDADNRLPDNASPSASSPAATPAPPALPPRPLPDHRQDPARVAQIAVCVQQIREGDLLPLIMRNGALALDPACLSVPELKLIDRFDGDPDIQAAYRESRELMKTRLAAAFGRAGPSPFEPGDDPGVRSGSLTKDLDRAYRLAARDHDVILMVAAGWRDRRDRDRREEKAALKAAQIARKRATAVAETSQDFYATYHADLSIRESLNAHQTIEKILEPIAAGVLGISRGPGYFRFHASNNRLQRAAQSVLDLPQGHKLFEGLCAKIEADPELGTTLPVCWLSDEITVVTEFTSDKDISDWIDRRGDWERD